MPSVKRVSVGSYFLALIFPPAYFFSRKRTGAGIFSLILLLVAFPLFFLFGLGIFVWLANALWAMWNLRYEMMDDVINAQATAIAKAMKKQDE